jgi:hypothetical protein
VAVVHQTILQVVEMVVQVAALLILLHQLVQEMFHQFLHLKVIMVVLQYHQVLLMMLAAEAVALQKQVNNFQVVLLKILAVMVHQMQYQVQRQHMQVAAAEAVEIYQGH